MVGERDDAGGPATRLRDALSDGRIAYVSNSEGVEQIDVLNLATRKVSMMATFPGSARVDGIGLRKNRLAWAQQSTGLNVVRTAIGGGFSESCERVQLSPVELASLDLRYVPYSPIVVSGVPIPPQYANEPPCSSPETAISWGLGGHSRAFGITRPTWLLPPDKYVFSPRVGL